MIISEVAQLIIVGIVGAFIGELHKSATRDISSFKFIVHFLANAFTGIVVGIMIKEHFFKEKSNLFGAGLAGFLSFIGQKKSVETFDSIRNIFDKKDKK